MRSIANLTASLVETATPMALFLLTTPLFLQALGLVPFGRWMLISTALACIPVLLLGMPDAVVKQVASAPQDPALARHLARWLRLALMVSVILAVVILLGGGVLSCCHRVRGLPAGPWGWRLLVPIAILSALRPIDVYVTSVLQGLHRFDLSSRAVVLCATVAVAINVFCAVRYHSLGIILAVLCGTQTVLVVVKFLLLCHVSPHLARILPGSGEIPSAPMTEFARLSWARLLGDTLLAQADRLLISMFLGVGVLGIYAPAAQLSSMVQVLPARALAFSFPLFTHYQQQGDPWSCARLLGKGSVVGAMIAAIVSVAILAAGPTAITWWIPGVPGAEISHASLELMPYFLLLCVTIMQYYALTGTSYVRLNTLLCLLSGVIATVTAALLLPRLGLWGVILGRYASLVSIPLAKPLLYRCFPGVPASVLARSDLLPYVVAILMLCGATVLVREITWSAAMDVIIILAAPIVVGGIGFFAYRATFRLGGGP